MADKKLLSRRNVLRSCGIAAGAALVPGISGARSQTPRGNDETYEQALQIMEGTQDVEKFRDHLANNGYKYNALDQTCQVPAPDGDDDDISPEYLDKADLQIHLTLSRPECSDPYDYHAELSFNWEWQGVDDWGVQPDDAIGMTWSDRHYWVPDLGGDEYWTSTSDISYDSESPEGIGFSVYDIAVDTQGLCSAGCELRWNEGTSDSAAQRTVYGEYEHTYAGAWSGMSISVGAVSLSWTSSGGSWDTSTDHNGDPLKVNAADLSYDDCVGP